MKNFMTKQLIAKSSVAKIATFVLTLTAASFVNASPFVTITDNYLYESLIQAEFDIENQMIAEVEANAQINAELVLMAKTDVQENSEKVTNEKAVEAAAE